LIVEDVAHGEHDALYALEESKLKLNFVFSCLAKFEPDGEKENEVVHGEEGAWDEKLLRCHIVANLRAHLQRGPSRSND